MISSPKNLTEQLLNLVERIAQEMKVILNTAVSKADKNHTHTTAQVTGLDMTLGTFVTKTVADQTYLGKTAKAVSAQSADAATKATNDHMGNIIATTYVAKTNSGALAISTGSWDTGASNLSFKPSEGKLVIAVGGTNLGGNMNYVFTKDDITGTAKGSVMWSNNTYNKSETSTLITQKINSSRITDYGMVNS